MNENSKYRSDRIRNGDRDTELAKELSEEHFLRDLFAIPDHATDLPTTEFPATEFPTYRELRALGSPKCEVAMQFLEAMNRDNLKVARSGTMHRFQSIHLIPFFKKELKKTLEKTLFSKSLLTAAAVLFLIVIGITGGYSSTGRAFLVRLGWISPPIYQMIVFRNGAMVRAKVQNQTGKRLEFKTESGYFKIAVDDVKRISYYVSNKSSRSLDENLFGKQAKDIFNDAHGTDLLLFRNGLIIRGRIYNRVGDRISVRTTSGSFRVAIQALKKVRYLAGGT